MRAPRSYLVLLSALALVIAGCHPGAGIADRIKAAKSPIVREVELLPSAFSQNAFDQVIVYLVDDATSAQALDLWCTVVAPAGISQLPSQAIRFYKGGELAPEGGRSGAELVLTDPVVCPASPPPS